MLEIAMLDEARLDEDQRDLLAVTDALLTAIATGDAATYASLCLPELSCYEDVCSYRIDGLAFHLHLVARAASHPQPARTDILTPRVQVYGDTGIVTYTRLITHDDGDGLRWETYNETRVYVKRGGGWKMAHFHRSRTLLKDEG